jgi:hypothetical protein
MITPMSVCSSGPRQNKPALYAHRRGLQVNSPRNPAGYFSHGGAAITAEYTPQSISKSGSLALSVVLQQEVMIPFRGTISRGDGTAQSGGQRLYFLQKAF